MDSQKTFIWLLIEVYNLLNSQRTKIMQLFYLNIFLEVFGFEGMIYFSKKIGEIAVG